MTKSWLSEYQVRISCEKLSRVVAKNASEPILNRSEDSQLAKLVWKKKENDTSYRLTFPST